VSSRRRALTDDGASRPRRAHHAGRAVQPALTPSGKADPDAGPGLLGRREDRRVGRLGEDRRAALGCVTDRRGLDRHHRLAVRRRRRGRHVGAGDPARIAPLVQSRRLPGRDHPQPGAALLDDLDRLAEEKLGEHPVAQVTPGGHVEALGPPLWVGLGVHDGRVDLSDRPWCAPQGGARHTDRGACRDGEIGR
jgi:hypothetical protein